MLEIKLPTAPLTWTPSVSTLLPISSAMFLALMLTAPTALLTWMPTVSTLLPISFASLLALMVAANLLPYVAENPVENSQLYAE